MRLGPDLGDSVVLVNERDLLDGRPAHERVVSDEGSDLPVGAAERNSLVDSTGEVSDTVLEVVTDDEHDVRLVLDDGHLGGGVELGRGVEEAVLRDTRVRVDDEDVLAAEEGRGWMGGTSAGASWDTRYV